VYLFHLHGGHAVWYQRDNEKEKEKTTERETDRKSAWGRVCMRKKQENAHARASKRERGKEKENGRKKERESKTYKRLDKHAQHRGHVCLCVSAHTGARACEQERKREKRREGEGPTNDPTNTCNTAGMCVCV